MNMRLSQNKELLRLTFSCNPRKSFKLPKDFPRRAWTFLDKSNFEKAGEKTRLIKFKWIVISW